MKPKDQLIHDIVVLEERINFYNAHNPGLVDEIEKLKRRQRSAIDAYVKDNSQIMRDYRKRARGTAKAKTLELLFKETHNHVGTSPTPCIFDFQFDGIVDKVDEIYNPKVCLDDEMTGSKSVDSEPDKIGIHMNHEPFDEERMK